MAAPEETRRPVTTVPHAAGIIQTGVCLGLLALLQWNLNRKCKCGDKQSFLRPKWKKTPKKWDDGDL